MDEPYLYAATRCVELDPVRAKLVSDPTEYRWSSARAHVDARDDALEKLLNRALMARRPGRKAKANRSGKGSAWADQK